MNEEKYIEEQVGRRNPFTVPEGYFDTFADQLMASLPERQPRTKYVWLRPLRYAAAVRQPIQAEAIQVSSDVAFDEAADYAMIDNYDIYACLSEE